MLGYKQTIRSVCSDNVYAKCCLPAVWSSSSYGHSSLLGLQTFLKLWCKPLCKIIQSRTVSVWYKFIDEVKPKRVTKFHSNPSPNLLRWFLAVNSACLGHFSQIVCNTMAVISVSPTKWREFELADWLVWCMTDSCSKKVWICCAALQQLQCVVTQTWHLSWLQFCFLLAAEPAISAA